MTPFSFELQARQGQARAGRLQTPHGLVETPVFMPVGTQSAVKGLTWPQVHEAGAQVVLANAYHLYLRPGVAAVAAAGGLHAWTGWPRPILTDSGGFQVFSLSAMRQVSETGVTFRDPVNGSTHFLGPKEAMAVQNGLGADIIMAFDECPPYPVDLATATASLARTHRWLEACFAHHARPDTQALFPIVQGSTFLDLRAQSAAFVQQFQSVGVAIGGVSVGEPKAEIQAIVRETAPMLPENRPRYLMGVGTPEDLLWAIAAGIDMFDCVMPTRIARHGTFFTPTGRKIIKNSEFANDFSPLVPGCDCFTCVHHHRAYLRHLYRVGEGVAGTLLSIHNVRYLIRLAQTARQAVLAGTFADWHQAQTLASSPHGGQK